MKIPMASGWKAWKKTKQGSRRYYPIFRHPDERRKLLLEIQRLIKSRGSSLVPRDELWRTVGDKKKLVHALEPTIANHKGKMPRSAVIHNSAFEIHNS